MWIEPSRQLLLLLQNVSVTNCFKYLVFLDELFEGLLCYFLLINGRDLAHKVAKFSLELLCRVCLIDVLSNFAL